MKPLLVVAAATFALGCNAGDFTFRPRVPVDAPQGETVVMDETLTGLDGPTVDAAPDTVPDTAPDASPDDAPDGAPDALDAPVIQDTPDVLVSVDVTDVSTDIPMPLDVRDASPEVLDAPILCARTDQCPMGQFCGSRGTCLSRCTGNSDCRSASTEPLCNPMSMVCVSGTTSCRTRADCAGLDCSDTGLCTQSCVSASTCVAGQFCSTSGYCTFGCSGSPCPSGLVCRGGSCGAPGVDGGVMDVTPTDVPPPPDVSGCMAPTPTRCGATCVDTLSNASHCGACGTVCSLSNATPRCLNGACRVDTCNAGFGNCDALATNGCETDLRTSSTHCGACDLGCTPPRVCNAGVCSTTCTGTMCGTSCVFTDRDVSNCGACGQVCSAVNGVAACGLSRCSITCNAGFGDCDATRPGCETGFRDDTAHCGRCGNACPAGQACISGTCGGGPCPVGQALCGLMCVDTTTSSAHCGGCNRPCSAAMPTCRSGVCGSSCPGATQTNCSGTCVDTQSDASHCGGCGVRCPAGTACTAGRCGSGCPSGQTACGTVCADLNASLTNCGRCGNVCATGRSCSGGNCTLVCAAPLTACGSTCTDTARDPANCGVCGSTCSGFPCTSGLCGGCGPGLTSCAGRCVDLAGDASNCGACGRVCSPGQACVYNACTSTPTVAYRALLGFPVTFIDACAASGHVEVLALADDGATLVNLPFPFRYWATNLRAFSPINVVSNGWIGLNGTLSSAYNFMIPVADGSNAVVAGYEGDDQNRGSQCIVTLGGAPSRVWVHQWNDSHLCCGDMPTVHTTYEIILYERTNIIDIVYQNMMAPRPSVVGIENFEGTRAVGGCPDGSSLCVPPSGYSVRFQPI